MLHRAMQATLVHEFAHRSVTQFQSHFMEEEYGQEN